MTSTHVLGKHSSQVRTSVTCFKRRIHAFTFIPGSMKRRNTLQMEAICAHSMFFFSSTVFFINIMPFLSGSLSDLTLSYEDANLFYSLLMPIQLCKLPYDIFLLCHASMCCNVQRNKLAVVLFKCYKVNYQRSFSSVTCLSRESSLSVVNSLFYLVYTLLHVPFFSLSMHSNLFSKTWPWKTYLMYFCRFRTHDL
jgi:hypothetical protein